MDSTIIVALITGGFALCGSLITAAVMNSKTLYRIELLENNQKEQFTKLEAKQDKHNEVVERMFIAERDIKVLDQEVKECRDDIKEIKIKSA